MGAASARECRLRTGIPRETASDERRVAAVPETVRKITDKGADVLVEADAGAAASYSDAAYEGAGARIAAVDEVWSADVVLKVAPPTAEEVRRLRSGAVLVSFLDPDGDADVFRALVDSGSTALAMQSIPRIARAQKMDALSAMANLAGYKAVLEAANTFGRYFPLLMTAAGTVTPAHVLVIGAGVAGLSAIATARRLGAVVRAFDPRPPVREQVESLGARFIELEVGAIEETAGGYAAAQSEAFLQKERELLAGHVADVDVVVTTAAIPGQPAPVLITEEMARSMKPGSVIVDLAAERGGNCALTVPGEVRRENGLTVIGHTNFASRMAEQASLLYARTVWNLLSHLWGENGVKIDLEDEIVTAAALVHAGEDRRSRKEA
ncbi:MAG: Re/Si-specific NAD(P)(+) transhydrogenase subunit alpha [Gemmatimonadota bacterium]